MTIEDLREFMTITWGLAYVKPQRWNNPERDCLWYGLNLQEDEVQHDQHLHNILLHGIAHNLMDGYMHYSFELPVWIREGYAHWAEQRNDTRFNTFCTVEGSLHEGQELDNWAPAVRKLVQKDEAASFASLLRRTSYAELGWEDHLVCWSKMDFLLASKPKEFGQFLTALCSKVDDQGLPDGSGLDDAQRSGFQEAFGWSILKAEREGQAWVLENYPSK